MVMDHSYSDRGNLLLLHGLLIPISSKGSFICTIIHTTAFGTPVMDQTELRAYLWLYGIGHMVKDHSDSENGNLLLPHRLLFPINSKGSFICTIPQTR